MKKRIKKNCLVCKCIFFVVPSLLRVKYCSRKCYEKEWIKRVPGWNKGLKGIQVAWNRGIKRPEISLEKHPNWRGGRSKTKNGYIRVCAPDHPSSCNGYVLEHRIVMERHLGRYLKTKEIVHHIDENRTNNKIDNLKLLSIKEHTIIHKKRSK